MLRAMRRLGVLPLLLACTCCPKPGSTTNPPKAGEPTAGIFVEDLDRTADPCTDFYEFANGTWRAQHPIPASQPRWSRRWESGELAKERLKDILDEVSAKTDWPAHGVEQLIGDFYGACMDDARAESLGAKPLEPMLGKLAAIKDRAGLQEAIVELHWQNIGVPFVATANNDLHDPTDVVTIASGLMPTSCKYRNAPTWKSPRMPPPPSTNATRSRTAMST
jgi:predicted metalloendopeptidase